MKHTDVKRRQILDVAMQTFLNKGYKGASMQHIASEAQVSKRTLYKHFPNKDDLLSHVLGQFMEQGTRAASLDFTLDRPIDEQLHELLLAKIKLLQSDNYRGLLKILLPEALLQSERGDYLTRNFPYTQGPLVNWLVNAEKQHILTFDDLMTTALFIQGALEKHVLWPQLIHGHPEISQAQTEKIVNALVSMIIQLYATDDATLSGQMSAQHSVKQSHSHSTAVAI